MALWIPVVGESYDYAFIGTLKFLSLAQGLCPNSPDPFPTSRVGSGDNTEFLLLTLWPLINCTCANAWTRLLAQWLYLDRSRSSGYSTVPLMGVFPPSLFYQLCLVGPGCCLQSWWGGVIVPDCLYWENSARVQGCHSSHTLTFNNDTHFCSLTTQWNTQPNRANPRLHGTNPHTLR